MNQMIRLCQRTELGGCAVVNASDRAARCCLEYDTDDGMTHIIEEIVKAGGHAQLPMSRQIRLVHKETRKTILTFEPWSFQLVYCTKQMEFIVKYVQGPSMRDTKVVFYPAQGGVSVRFGEPIDVLAPDEWHANRSYTLQVRLPRGCVYGKFVIEDREGLYSSMIPWAMPSLKNPSYTMGQLVAPLLVQTALAAAVHRATSDSKEPVASTVLNTLLTSLVGMHGPMMLAEMSRGMSPSASAMLPRPSDKSSNDGIKRLFSNADLWRRVIASVVGTAAMGK